jgi:hypothetical protein
MMADATRVAPRRGEVQQPHTISAYAPNDRGGIVENVRSMMGMSNIPQEPGLLGKLASVLGLNDPMSMTDGPARAMGVVAKAGKAQTLDDVLARLGTSAPRAPRSTDKAMQGVRAALKMPDGTVTPTARGETHADAVAKVLGFGSVQDILPDDIATWERFDDIMARGTHGFVDAANVFYDRDAAAKVLGSLDSQRIGWGK